MHCGQQHGHKVRRGTVVCPAAHQHPAWTTQKWRRQGRLPSVQQPGRGVPIDRVRCPGPCKPGLEARGHGNHVCRRPHRRPFAGHGCSCQGHRLRSSHCHSPPLRGRRWGPSPNIWGRGRGLPAVLGSVHITWTKPFLPHNLRGSSARAGVRRGLGPLGTLSQYSDLHRRRPRRGSLQNWSHVFFCV